VDLLETTDDARSDGAVPADDQDWPVVLPPFSNGPGDLAADQAKVDGRLLVTAIFWKLWLADGWLAEDTVVNGRCFSIDDYTVRRFWRATAIANRYDVERLRHGCRHHPSCVLERAGHHPTIVTCIVVQLEQR
jgi:hypothetical protein